VNKRQLDRIQQLIKPYRVTRGKGFRLKDLDPADTGPLTSESKAEAKEMLSRGVEWLAEEQDKLYAQDHWGVLLIFQAMDAAGKDGTIKHVMSGINPQGCQVTPFKQPSAEELDHDYLWRYVRHVPGRGQIGIFNRSYYEEVLVVRVHPEILQNQQLPRQARGRDVWKKRYRDINEWERYLTDNGFTVVKLFLNLSKEEQRIRFLRRIDLPDHNWKFSAADVKERSHWDDYQKAFSAMLSATSTEWAPWYVIPADHKWFARLCASAIIANALIEIDPKFPKVSPEAHDALMETKGLLEAEAPDGAEADPFATEELAKAAKAEGKGGKKGKKKGGQKAKKSK
jgi:PPK2 family polyphosphate:nucleotide phosphotransferase